MNRNTESHFAELPQVNIERSIFDRSFSHKTSFNVADLVPFYLDEVLPGDTFNVTTSAVVRLQTLLTPVMDNMYLDTYFFFVPSRLTWTHWKEFMGENTESAWIPQTEYTVPVLKLPENGFDVGTIADYFGVPTGVYNSAPEAYLSALPFRAYALICDEWFRDQNVMDPLNIPLGDSSVVGSNGSNYITDVAKGGKPFKAAKYHDYFTSVLPSPQKGSAVVLNPFENVSGDGFYPVGTTGSDHDAIKYGSDLTTAYALRATESSGYDTDAAHRVGHGTSDNLMYFNAGSNLTPTNLWANLGESQLSVNDLRLAFQLQKFYEKNARAGTRYREVLREHFGVTSPDARMMIPEYLGGHRFPLSIHQVANTAQG